MSPVVHFLLPEGPQRAGRTVYRPVLPRGVLQVARAAEAAGWQAAVLDGYSAPHLLPAYLQLLRQSDAAGVGAEMEFPDLVGISVHGPPSIGPALAIAAQFREIQPSLPLLFGGQLANADADLLLPLLPERSILFCGDGDTAIAEVLQKTLQTTGGARIIRMPGIVPWHSQPDLNLLLPHYAAYFGEPDFEYHLETQIGCPYRCFHCGTGRQGLYATTKNRPIDSILAELDQIRSWAQQANLPLPSLWITDETFGSDPDHARQFCDALIERGEAWRWRAQSRADVISEAMSELMRKAGCQRLAFGVEIPNDTGLDLLGKREGMKDVREAFAISRRAGISPEAIIVVGTPGDSTSPEQFLDALNSIGAASVQSYIYHPIPGSPWWSRYGASLLAQSDITFNWSRLDFHSPSLNGPAEEIERAIVSFLALSLWRPGLDGVTHIPKESTGWEEVFCELCGSKTRFDVLFMHTATRISVARYRLDGKIYYTATDGGESAQVLEFDPSQHRNLYCGLSSVSRQALSFACPRCLAGEAEVESSNTLASSAHSL